MRMQKSKRSRRFRKSRKNRTRRRYPRLHDKTDLLIVSNKKLKGGVNTPPIEPTAPITCCMCGNQFPRNEMMVPAVCLKKNKERAHRICQNCWWNPETGFARENAPHGCPGCNDEAPLNPPVKPRIPRDDEIIDL